MRWHFSGTKQAALQGHSDAQNNLAIFMKTEKALLKTRHSPHSGISQQGNRHAQFQIAWDYNAGEPCSSITGI